ncbi:MAG: M28 family peptidase, partial [Proteobacteria bacterium]
LQNDMNMYRSNDQDTVWLITNDTDSTLTKDVIGLAKTYQSSTVAVNSGYLAAGSSDHRAWTRQGFAAVFPTENPNAYNHAIHTTRDTIANSGVFTQSREFSKLSLSFLAHFAGLIQE